MTDSKPGWTLVLIFLVVVIVAGGAFIWSRLRLASAIEISVACPPASQLPGQIYVGGAVSNPGFYPLRPGDSVDELVRAAGGVAENAGAGLELQVSISGEQPQKVNINRAEAWLLKALPGIGEARAQAIIDYRSKNGPFSNVMELTRVEGISTAICDNIKHLVTVAD